MKTRINEECLIPVLQMFVLIHGNRMINLLGENK